ncbi:MAG: hypothetical protein HY554_09930 [Elusimicrobia bacterium]|nr:hypothetical protein [Elusimicrobiota bacterium]
MRATWGWAAAPLVAASAWSAAPRTALRLVSNTGHVVVSYRGESWLGGRQVELPMALPPGAEVFVVTGRVVAEGCGLVVRGTEGDMFTYNAFPEEEGCRAPLQLAATGEGTSLDVEVGEAKLFLGDGDAISVARTQPGTAEVTALAGFIEVALPAGERYLSPGQQVAVADLVAAGDEDLRSAVGPLPAPGAGRRTEAAGPKPEAPRPGPSPTALAESPARPLLLPALVVSTLAVLLLELSIRYRRLGRRRRGRLLHRGWPLL